MAAPRPGANDEEITDAHIAGLLADVNRSLAARDQAAYVSLHAVGDAAGRARRILANLGLFDLEHLSFKLAARRPIRFDRGDRPGCTVEVLLIHQVRAVDAQPVAAWFLWRLARIGGRVVISAIDPDPRPLHLLLDPA